MEFLIVLRAEFGKDAVDNIIRQESDSRSAVEDGGLRVAGRSELVGSRGRGSAEGGEGHREGADGIRLCVGLDWDGDEVPSVFLGVDTTKEDAAVCGVCYSTG